VTVAVCPFAVFGDDSRSWLGGAMQEGIDSNLSRQSGVTMALISPANPNDLQSAISAARDAKADFVILGNIQIVQDQLRVNGKLVSVATGKTVSRLGSDGALTDLFSMEDVMSSKAQRLMRPGTAAPIATAAVTFQMVGPTIPASGKYFDGNAMETFAPQPQFTDEANHYYYNGSIWNGGYWCGWGWGWYRGCYFPCWGWGGCGGTPVVQLGEW
jgi:TolB-like protein